LLPFCQPHGFEVAFFEVQTTGNHQLYIVGICGLDHSSVIFRRRHEFFAQHMDPSLRGAHAYSR
jgi:hypothetical protein